jgi:hypothetical protein
MSFKPGHVSIPKRRIFLPLFLFCAYESSVLQNFKIFTHLLPNCSYKNPWLTEATYHCINFNDRVRTVQNNYYLKVWNVSFDQVVSGEKMFISTIQERKLPVAAVFVNGSARYDQML